MNQIKTVIICLFLVAGNYLFSYSQNGGDTINIKSFNTKITASLLLDKINKQRKDNNLDDLVINEVLNEASRDQAKYMLTANKATVEQDNRKTATTSDRVKMHGGLSTPERVGENVTTYIIKGAITYDVLTDSIVSLMIRSADGRKKIFKSSFLYSGVGIDFDQKKKKVFISQTFADNGIFNPGPQNVGKLPVSYSKKKFGVKPYDKEICKDCEKFAHAAKLQRGLYVKDGIIYLSYDKADEIDRLLEGSKDGFTVDIIQREQFPCNGDNIYDNTLVNKGIMLKPTYKKKFFKKNNASKKNALNVPLGTLPAGLKKYEINLVLLSNKRYCRSVTRSSSDTTKVIAPMTMEMLPDTMTYIHANLNEAFNLNELKKQQSVFTVPFAVGKYTYKKEDLTPFMEAFLVASKDYTIEAIEITAHSSLEGSPAFNARLRMKRAKSIVNALVDKNVPKKINYDDSWEMFKEQIKSTKWSNLSTETKMAVIKALNSKRAMRKEMEPILAQQRFAAIELRIVGGVQKETVNAFLERQLKKAISDKKYIRAYAIQKQMMAEIKTGSMKPEAMLQYSYPVETEFAPMILNKLWMESMMRKEGQSNEEQLRKSDELSGVAPQNPYVRYNSLLYNISYVKNVDQTYVDSMQTKIDELYKYPEMEKDVNALNLAFQLNIMDVLSKETKNPIVDNAMNKITTLYKPEENTWQMALRVAQLFGKRGNLRYAIDALTPGIASENSEVSEEFIFTYINMAYQFLQGKPTTKDFRGALMKAKEKNPTKYCMLFGSPNLSFQLLDDPFIKKLYCESCK